MAPLIDVLMPAYNAGWSLPDTLASIQVQTVRDIRIVVVDDGSTDDTASILAAAAERDPRIHVITQPNGGIVAALNAGLAACTAPFIARHDADDLSDPDRFERQMQYLEANPDCVALAGAARHIDEAGHNLSTQSRLRDLAKADPGNIPASEPYLLHPMLMVRRADIQAVGGYRLVLNAEDSDLYWRLRERGRLHNLPELLGSYRMHAASVSSQSIFNGRQLALSSQLAAISARRRASKAEDIVFDAAFLREIKRPLSMVTIHDVGSRNLTPAERDWLAVALSMKLLELCFYRPFELTLADCQFVHAAIAKHGDVVPDRNLGSVREALIGTSVRLALRGRTRSAIVLAGPKLLSLVVLRLLFRIVLSNGLRSRIKRMTRRSGPVPLPVRSADRQAGGDDMGLPA
ncbi:MAG: glycosyltransferase family 2 protein [Janthinobacterium lividum]